MYYAPAVPPFPQQQQRQLLIPVLSIGAKIEEADPGVNASAGRFEARLYIYRIT
jgi:hypothetical protein